MTYTLRKLELEEGSQSKVPEGYSSSLPFMVFYHRDTDTILRDVSVGDLKVGVEVLLQSLGDFHKTSAVREILEQDDKRAVFLTQTSKYELIDNNEDEDE